MIALPKGVSVTIGGRTWTGEIPADLCPAHLLPVSAAPERPDTPPRTKPKAHE